MGTCHYKISFKCLPCPAARGNNIPCRIMLAGYLRINLCSAWGRKESEVPAYRITSTLFNKKYCCFSLGKDKSVRKDSSKCCAFPIASILLALEKG